MQSPPDVIESNAEFIERALRSGEEAKRTGAYLSADEMPARLRARLAQAQAQANAREIDLKLAREIAQGHFAAGEASVMLFGSSARGDARRWSDIDLAVIPKPANPELPGDSLAGRRLLRAICCSM